MATDDQPKPDNNVCPYCGSTSCYYDAFAFRTDMELPPKPWYGFDPYSDPDYHGAWICSSCGQQLSSR